MSGEFVGTALLARLNPFARKSFALPHEKA